MEDVDDVVAPPTSESLTRTAASKADEAARIEAGKAVGKVRNAQLVDRMPLVRVGGRACPIIPSCLFAARISVCPYALAASVSLAWPLLPYQLHC
jgi:hypothetical protein